jgi:hypothetical protein
MHRLISVLLGIGPVLASKKHFFCKGRDFCKEGALIVLAVNHFFVISSVSVSVSFHWSALGPLGAHVVALYKLQRTRLAGEECSLFA